MTALDGLLTFRKGTAAAWTSANPVLASGEPGYETDTGKLKIGDGTTAWNSRAYATPGAATEALAGWVELASNAETVTGTDAVRATHPAGVKAAIDARVASTTVVGMSELATNTETVTGTSTTLVTTPAGVAAAIAAGAGFSLPQLVKGKVNQTSTGWTQATGTATDLTGVTLTLTLDTTHTYEVIFRVNVIVDVTATQVTWQFVENGTVRQFSTFAIANTNNPVNTSLVHSFAPAAGTSIVYKIRGLREAGSGVITPVPTATSPLQFYIKDLGPT